MTYMLLQKFKLYGSQHGCSFLFTNSYARVLQRKGKATSKGSVRKGETFKGEVMPAAVRSLSNILLGQPQAQNVGIMLPLFAMRGETVLPNTSQVLTLDRNGRFDGA